VLTFSTLSAPKAIGMDIDIGFRARKGSKYYLCYCPKCNGLITQWADDPLNDYDLAVQCVNRHICETDDMAIVEMEAIGRLF